MAGLPTNVTTVDQMVEYLHEQARGYTKLARQLEQLKKRREDSTPAAPQTVVIPAKGKKSVGRPKGYSPKAAATATPTTPGGLTPEARQKIADAQKARWAKVNAEKAEQGRVEFEQKLQAATELARHAGNPESVADLPAPIPSL